MWHWYVWDIQEKRCLWVLVLESGVLGEMRNWAAAKDLIVTRRAFPWTILERPFCKEPFTPKKKNNNNKKTHKPCYKAHPKWFVFPKVILKGLPAFENSFLFKLHIWRNQIFKWNEFDCLLDSISASVHWIEIPAGGKTLKYSNWFLSGITKEYKNGLAPFIAPGSISIPKL